MHRYPALFKLGHLTGMREQPIHLSSGIVQSEASGRVREQPMHRRPALSNLGQPAGVRERPMYCRPALPNLGQPTGVCKRPMHRRPALSNLGQPASMRERDHMAVRPVAAGNRRAESAMIAIDKMRNVNYNS